MRQFDVVIGANFGDEGKGVFTSFLATRNPDAIIVRFNGGSNASHTVTVEDPKMGVMRHAFRHLGSGTFSGNPTFLSEDFIINPLMLFEEMDVVIKKFGIIPRLIIDPNCVVSTPYDMLINQWLEESRNHRHGSCGVGINETVTRSQECPLMAKDIHKPKTEVYELIKDIRDIYFSARLNTLGLTLTNDQKELFSNEQLLENFVEDFMSLNMISQIPIKHILLSYDHLIFEGAQGLALDQTMGTFPHVTRSNTGLTNIAKYLQLTCTDDINISVHYMTRCYLTRHGEGPFNEAEDFPPIIDETNIPNEWQGTMRFGWLNIDELKQRIEQDLKNVCHIKNVIPSLNVTCLDQLHVIPVIKDGLMHIIQPKVFHRYLTHAIPNVPTKVTFSGLIDKWEFHDYT